MRQPLSGNWRVTSHFKSKARPTHSGTDYASTTDQNVYAVEAGRAELRYDSTSGYGVNVYSGNRKWEYLHLNKVGRASGTVSEGQKIGNYKPGSGKVSGPHLHLGLQIPHNGSQQNPYNYIEKHKTVVSSSVGDEVITSKDADILRIVNSEVKGWNPDEVHSGKFDQRELTAWTGKPIAQLIREGWKEGEAYRAMKRQLAQSNAQKDKLISELNITLAKLQDSEKVTKQDLQSTLDKVTRIEEDLLKERESSDNLREEMDKLKKPDSIVENGSPEDQVKGLLQKFLEWFRRK